MKYICRACGPIPCVYDDGNELVRTLPTDCPRKCILCKWIPVSDDYVIQR